MLTLLLIGISTLPFNLTSVKTSATIQATLLASIHDSGEGAWSVGNFSALVLSFAVNPDSPQEREIGDALNLSDGDTGSYDFDRLNEPDFSDMVRYLTNSQNDEVGIYRFFAGGGGGGRRSSEANMIGGNPDLAGSYISFIRLVVHSLSIYHPDRGGTQCDYDYTWEIWGHPVVMITSPKNITYTTSNFPLNYSTYDYTSWVGYSLNGKANVTLTGNTTLNNLSNGHHNIELWANDTSGNVAMIAVWFNVDTNAPTITWATKTSMPTSRTSAFCGNAVLNNEIYVVGGWSDGGLDKVEVYNVDQDTWRNARQLPSRRYDGTVQVVDDRIYIIGGKYWGETVSTVWEYDPATDSYTSKMSMPTGRRSLASAVVDGKIYTIGGVDTSNPYSNAVEMYDPSSDTWVTKASHPAPRQYLTAEAVNGKIYTFGGISLWNVSDSSILHEYDPITNVWTQKSSMPVTVEVPNSVVVDGKIYAVGGSGSKAILMYDVMNDIWHGPLDEELPTPRSRAVTAEVNGRIYVIGGTCLAPPYNVNEEGTILTPWTPTQSFDVVLEDIHYPVSILSNSTVSNFNFSQTERQISFRATGESGTTGYCNVTIPKSFLKGDPWTIKVDDTTVTEFDKKTNDTHTFLYFTFTHESPLQVTIQGTWVIPEFPSLLLLPVFMIATLVTAVYAKKRKRK